MTKTNDKAIAGLVEAWAAAVNADLGQGGSTLRVEMQKSETLDGEIRFIPTLRGAQTPERADDIHSFNRGYNRLLLQVDEKAGGVTSLRGICTAFGYKALVGIGQRTFITHKGLETDQIEPFLAALAERISFVSGVSVQGGSTKPQTFNQ